MTTLSDGNKQAVREVTTEVERALVDLQENKEHGQVVVKLDVKFGGVSASHCDKTTTKRLRG